VDQPFSQRLIGSMSRRLEKGKNEKESFYGFRLINSMFSPPSLFRFGQLKAFMHAHIYEIEML
jgi:hypothetical protein